MRLIEILILQFFRSVDSDVFLSEFLLSFWALNFELQLSEEIRTLLNNFYQGDFYHQFLDWNL